MAHTRKDTLTSPPEWWKHLRPFNKRKVAKSERRAAAKEINAELNDESEVSEKAAKLSDV
jgi:hypothetical protein